MGEAFSSILVDGVSIDDWREQLLIYEVVVLHDY